ncbi:MAG TPA: carboxylesterase family protein [Candidatus Limnocylindrales bacterium]|nr:carboxylesterase family protein [Candidatus Limnocylindrales bacterium]
MTRGDEMKTRQRSFGRLAALRAAAVLTTLAFVATGATTGAANARSTYGAATAQPVVKVDGGVIRGAVTSGGLAFRGIPYAAAPTGDLRWRPPAPVIAWQGIRGATQFGASCPQVPSTFATAPFDENCLFLNVYTNGRHGDEGDGRPVLVWIHGGGYTQGDGRGFDGTKLAQNGLVVVTINYRLGALGFLAHPALASAPGGPAGNYGLMDQQAALRWVQRNISRFGGDPENVTIAGQSAGALGVLVHLISPGSRGLFDRAIVQSGSFALNQLSLAQGEAFGQFFAANVGCGDQSAACLRSVPVSTLTDKFPGAAIPGIVDGAVVQESFGTALAAGRFARVPVINGITHDEQRVFVFGLQLTVTGGFFVPIPVPWYQITAQNYESVISAVLGVSAARAASIAAEYPVTSYLLPAIAFSTLDSDASWACPALQMDQWLSQRVPTFAYEFDDDQAPARYFANFPPPVAAATHLSELPYLFDLNDAPNQTPLSADQMTLAASIRAAWASFAATGDPADESNVAWPSFRTRHPQVISFVAPSPAVIGDFASRHHCAFWAAAQ